MDKQKLQAIAEFFKERHEKNIENGGLTTEDWRTALTFFEVENADLIEPFKAEFLEAYFNRIADEILVVMSSKDTKHLKHVLSALGNILMIKIGVAHLGGDVHVSIGDDYEDDEDEEDEEALP